MYNKVNPNLNFVERERETLKFWEENDIFKKQLSASEGRPGFTFYDGPPTANGKPHIGHVLTRVIKDMIPRYQWMKGRDVPRKAGWDTHGLPVEIEVEKKLGLDGKEQIEQYGLEPFINRCKESVWQYKHMWEDFSGTVGFWCDMENPYVTYENSYIESEWWALKEIWNKGLLYKGFKIVPYCPRCGTPLSAQEVAQGYKTVKERSAVVRFKVDGEDAYFLAWTTTPWTLPSNVALCVNPEETYAKVKAADGYVYYMAKALLDTVLGKLSKEDAPAYEILEEMPGSALEYRSYLPLWECTGEAAAKQRKKAHFITCDGYVTMSDGTGIVHIAPAFGEDDSRVGRKYDLPFVQFVDSKGEMTAETPYAGLFVKKADSVIISDLAKEGKLFDAPKFEHEYPHCWRCDTPLIYYARESWYIRMTAVRENLIRNNNTVNWIPESIGKGRFGDWLENVQDWAISRNRYWGTPLNIWECSCGCRHSVGSIAELKSMSKNCPDDIELHRPYIDAVTLVCPECGGEMKRVPEVIDCWFDSGSMPFAQHHYPFENEDKFKAQFPADFISEAVDQTRGWFYSLMAISTLLFDCSPYKNVLVLGHVQDENGQKMSKSKGNAVDPFDALETYGADAIRWYFYTNSAPWLPSRFSGKAVQEGQRKFLGTLWNTYAFYVLYAEIDGFDPTKYDLSSCKLTVMDQYILSVLNATVKTVDSCLSSYRIPEAANALEKCVDELSNWYVRRSRERYWGPDMTDDKIAAYMTLYTALVTIAKASAPMVPFMADEIYRGLVCPVDPSAPVSVHLCSFPKADESRINAALTQQMDAVIDIVVLGRAARNAANLKNRQPLAALYVKPEVKPDEEFTEIIRDELNVKDVKYIEDASELSAYLIKPNLKTVGPKYGKLLGKIRAFLQDEAFDGNAAMAEFNKNGKLTLDIDGTSVELTGDDMLVEIKSKEGFCTQADHGVTVALDIRLTDELIAEGFVRETISKIQTMRKEADFVVTDHIRVTIACGVKLKDRLSAAEADLRSATLCDELIFAEPSAGYRKEWDINGETAVIAVEKI
ncbi:MAG: isoleucine--tRNA ligase [Clostridia bacterium]|nr:isoleucine--tRNA ligase [Clostridia bacterium]